METIKRDRTNDQAFRDLLYHLDSIQLVLLRERILTICEETAKECDSWEKPFVNPRLYKDLNKVVQKHLGFDEEFPNIKNQ